LAGDGVVVLRAAVQSSESFAGIAQALTTIEAEQMEQQPVQTEVAPAGATSPLDT